MQIGIDLAPMRPPFTGISNVTLYLLEALGRRHPEFSISGFGRWSWQTVTQGYLRQVARSAGKPLADYGQHSAEPLPPALSSRIRAAVLPYIREITPLVEAHGKLRSWKFAQGVKRQGLSVFHAPAYLPPGECDAPILPLVHDLSHIRHPQTHPIARLRYMERLPSVLEKAPYIQTVSAFTARELQDYFSISSKKIIITPPGVSPIFFHNPEVRPATLEKYSLQAGQYFLTAATLEPRKNLKVLLQAFDRLPVRVQQAYPLVIVGPRGWGKTDYPPSLERRVAEGVIRFVGYVTDQELSDLYGCCQAFAYPSIYEGFGMPLAEALAAGATVLSSQEASMPEVVSDQGLLLSPYEPEAWAQALLNSLETRVTPQQRAARKAWAAQFTWERMADSTASLYRAVGQKSS